MKKKRKKRFSEFPCIGCVVIMCCTALCNKLIIESKIIKKRIMGRNQCPDCGGDLLNSVVYFLHYVDISKKCKDCEHQFVLSDYLSVSKIIKRVYNGEEQRIT